MKKLKEGVIFFGAVLLSLLMVSSATAVPQVHSQPLTNQLEKQNDADDLSELITDLTDYTDFEVDKKRFEMLDYKIKSFLSENNIGVDNYQESDLYQSSQFQALLNKNGNFENQLEYLADDVSEMWELYYTQYGEEYAKEFVTNELIMPFFEDFFSGTEYSDLLSYFESDSRALAEELGEVYNAKSKNVINSDSENEQETVGSLGFILEQALIGICTVVFLINWILFGNTLGQVTQTIVAAVLWVLLLIPATIILTSDVVVGSAEAAFEALLVAITNLFQIFADSLSQFIWNAGIFGFVIWAIGFIVNLPFLPIEFFVTFLVAFYEYAEYEVGYVINHLGPLATEILLRAAENAEDIWNSLFGQGRGSSSENIKLVSFFVKLADKFPYLKLILLKNLA